MKALVAGLPGSGGYREYYSGLYRDDAPGWQNAKDALVLLKKTCKGRGIALQVVLLPELHELVSYPFVEEYSLVGDFLRSQDISPQCPFILSAFGQGAEVDRIEVTSIPDDSEFFWDPEDPAGDPLVFIMSSFGDTCPPNRFVGMTGWAINE